MAGGYLWSCIFDIDNTGKVSYQEFVTAFRSKLTGLDQNNMLAIEKSLKKSFKNLDENNVSSDILKIQVGPVQFTKICVSLMWFMLVYLHFKENDSN